MVNHVQNKSPFETPIQFLKGVGPYLGNILEKRGIKTVLDLLYHFPTKYLDYRHIDTIRTLTPGKNKCIIAEVIGIASRPLGRSRKRIGEMSITDGTGVMKVVWFHFNEKYLKSKYPSGKKVFIAGECQHYGGIKQFTHPDILDVGQSLPDQNILPIYPLSEGLHQKTLHKIIQNAIKTHLDFIKECPYTVRASGESQITIKEALFNIHQPSNEENIDDLNQFKSKWHQRLSYDELFYLQLGLSLRKRGYQQQKGIAYQSKINLLNMALKELPFKLTQAQQRVIDEILKDQLKIEPMHRLVQGDVGCGKTLVAFLSSLQTIENGYQVAFMAPTEILAIQHTINLKKIADPIDVRIECLTGSTKKKKREQLLADLKSGHIHILIGTHALIQEGVDFKKLGFIIFDEQHRFGVMQRKTLIDKGDKSLIPDVLSMTATPIPRTLSMGLYGDLDVSTIDERPKGRKPIKTRLFSDKLRDKCYTFILQELNKGRQAYFIYPLVEETEKSDLKAATEMAKNLTEVFKPYKVALLHGKMKAQDKDEIMAAFKRNDYQVLVSTTVVEVGVDVPNATIMVIEHAERFGLSQLHQLRGRVGRGEYQSYCFLIAGYAQSEETKYRLHVMEKTDDGFVIAEEDLKIRGPGDFLGTRQSGLPELKLTHLMGQTKLLEKAKKRVEEIMEEDPFLKEEKHQRIKEILKERWEGKLDLANIS